MVGVAPAANGPSPALVPAGMAAGMISGDEDTAAGLPPDMGQALAELARERDRDRTSGPPATRRMSELPQDAPHARGGTASLAPGLAGLSNTPSTPPRAGAGPTRVSAVRGGSAPLAPRVPSIAVPASQAPRSAPSIPPSGALPRSSPSLVPGSVPPYQPAPSFAPPPAFVQANGSVPPAGGGVPSTDPMALPLERKPLVTTAALSPIRTPGTMAIVGGVAQRPSAMPLPMPPSMQAPPTMLAQQQPMLPPAHHVQSEVQLQMQAQAQAQQRAQAQAQMQAQQQAQAQAQIQQMQLMQMQQMQAQIARPSSVPGAIGSAPFMAQQGMAHGMAPLARPSTSPMGKPLPAPSTPKAFSPSPSGGDEESSPLTYQVYAADAAPSQRAMAPSQVSFSDVLKPKPSIGKRVGFALVGVSVVVATAVLIIVGTADDPPSRTALPSASANASATLGAAGAAGTAAAGTVAATAAVTAPPAEPPPTVASVSTTTAADAPAPTPTTVKSAKPKASAAAAPPKPAPSLKGVALPPNPFGGGPAPSLKPPGKRK